MRAFLIIITVCLLPSVAAANTFETCARAIENNDINAASLAAKNMLIAKGVSNPSYQVLGAQCLTFATGIEHVYDPVSAAFVRVSRQEEAREKERLAAQAKEFEQEKSRRRFAVWSAVFDACEDLYFDEPSQALTNRVCLDYFLESGLPVED